MDATASLGARHGGGVVEELVVVEELLRWPAPPTAVRGMSVFLCWKTDRLLTPGGLFSSFGFFPLSADFTLGSGMSSPWMARPPFALDLLRIPVRSGVLHLLLLVASRAFFPRGVGSGRPDVRERPERSVSLGSQIRLLPKLPYGSLYLRLYLRVVRRPILE